MLRCVRASTSRTGTTLSASASTASSSSTGPDRSSSSLEAFLDRTGQRVPDAENERWVSYHIADLYPAWHEQAHCKGVGVDYYFGDEDGQPTMSINQVRRAAKLCDVCPVFYECLHHALTRREEYGVWAGTSGRVRRRIFKLVDNGHTTVDEVLEAFRHGQGDRYRVPYGEEEIARPQAAQQRGLGAGYPGVRAEGGRQVAL